MTSLTDIQSVELINPSNTYNTVITGGLVPKGAYAAGTDYAVGDSVDYGGSSYVMYNNAPAGTLPTDTDYWQVLANKGDTGSTGPEGDQGPIGNQGSQGSQGNQGNQGSLGNQGTQGNQGNQGNQGTVGSQGNQGNQGSVGAQGNQGNNGEDSTVAGPQGNQGDVGSQGNQGNQGIQGSQGNQGDTGEDSTVAGPQGNQGDIGPQGEQGNQGNQGNTGAASTVAGPQGNQGEVGPQGLQGVQGTQGVQGPQGDIGPQGNQGETGEDSTVAGPQGNQGNQGTQGNQGNTGEDSTVPGPQGNQGSQGNQGAQGEDGVDGPQGNQGNQGNQGTQGEDGIDGAQGNQGFQGNQGTAGAQGNQGNQGTAGSQGNQGLQGSQGYQGNQGDTASVATDTIWDATGDLVAGTGSNTAARLANGITGQVLTAVPNTTIPTGLRWTDPMSSLARQAIINGNFDVWQRGTSFTLSGAAYTADRWVPYLTGSTVVHSQQAFTIGQTDVPNEPKYFFRSIVTSSAGASNRSTIAQRIESVRTFAGQTVTLSFWAKADASKNIAVEFFQSFGTGGSPSASNTAMIVSKIALTTSWAKYTVTGDVDSISGKTLGTTDDGYLAVNFWFDAGSDFNARTDSLGQQSGTFDIAQVQLCAGDVALPFMPKSFEEELRACQRYYVNLNNSVVYSICAVGSNISTTQANLSAFLPVQTRTSIPTLDTLTASQFSLGYGADSGGGSGVACTDLVLAGTAGDACNSRVVSFKATVASGLTAGRGSCLYANASNIKLGVSYEL